MLKRFNAEIDAQLHKEVKVAAASQNKSLRELTEELQ